MDNNGSPAAIICAFLAGILSIQGFGSVPGDPELLLALLLVIVSANYRFSRLLFFCLGFIWVSISASAQLNNQLAKQLEGQDISISGTIVSLPETDDYRSRFLFEIDQAKSQNLPKRIKLTRYRPTQTMTAGQNWRFTVRLKRPRGLMNPGAFDYERWLFSQGIGATGYIRPQPAPVLLNPNPDRLNFNYWRQTLGRHLDRKHRDTDYLGVLKALSIGDRQQISPAQWRLFRDTGTVHIIAISGLHIGLIASLVFLPVFKLSARLHIKRVAPAYLAAVFAMFAASCYAALAGFSIPTQRALIMLLAAMFCLIRQRHQSALSILALALFAVLIIDPLAVLSAGFWLSFMAVLLIIYLLAGRLNPPGYWPGMIKINSLISLGLIPLLIYFFQQCSVIAPLANFVAVPVISFWVAPLILAALLSYGVSPGLSDLLLDGGAYGIKCLLWFLDYFATFDWGRISLPAPSLWVLLFAGLGLFVIFMPRGLPGRYLGFMLLLPLIFVPADRPSEGQIRLTLLDVGQGLAAVVQTRDRTLVYDTGGRFSARFDIGDSVLAPFLRQHNIGRIDTLIISHGDNDHIGGAASLLRQIPVDAILSSVPDAIDHTNARPCRAGRSWLWNQVRFTVLAPGNERLIGDNDNSCVLKVETKTGSVLFTGDIELAAEQSLLKNKPGELAAKILIAPHHGSNTSSSLSFLQQVQPELILIPAGYRNRYGFPDRRVLARYAAVGAPWLNVSEQGAITIESDDYDWLVQRYRNNQGRYWNQHAR